jgi:hypothetical protein
MRKIVQIIATLAGVAIGVYVFWRRNPRTGTRIMNDVVNPFLVRTVSSGAGRSELGTIEHVGRRSGTRRLTPVYPVATADGFRILVPLGLESRWAQNVLAAGHCRMQLHGTVYELDEPALLLPREMAELRTVIRFLAGQLGFMYLRLHRFADAPGSLVPAAEPPAHGEIPADQAAAEAAGARDEAVGARVPEAVGAEA